MKLNTLIKRLQKHSDLWKSRGWHDPTISEVIVDSSYLYISFCSRKVFDKELKMTVHKRPSTKIILRGKF